MQIGVVQASPDQDKRANIARIRELAARAAQAGQPELLLLPEMWACLGGDASTRAAAAEALPPPGSDQAGGEAYEAMRAIAMAHGVHLHGGSIAERAEGRLFNTSVVFGPDGRETARYRKIHLFDVETPDGAGYRESALFGRGAEPVTFELRGVRAGCAICYDLRFPELFARLRAAGAELILLPAAFTLATGRDHWEVLLRARAIETQCWIAAAGTCGPHRAGDGSVRHTYGHSLVCDPWGRVAARAGDGPGFACAPMDRALTARVRQAMPVAAHRVLP